MYKFLLVLLLTFSFALQGQDIQEVTRGPVHEAFITQEYGQGIYEMVQEAPPVPLEEKAPAAPLAEALWIGGYWDWSEGLQDFVWMSGVWRVPPQGHLWISGEWQEKEGGWVRFPGFWSKVSRDQLTYIHLAPPESLDECPISLHVEDCFWVLGCWEYDKQYERYDWREGRLQHFDPNGLFVPGRYLWRPEGYVYIAAYWDWPLEERGTLYAPVTIKPEVRSVIPYEPTLRLTTEDLLVRLFPYWPNYLYCYQTYHHYHPHYWQKGELYAPWWNLRDWWAFTWKDQLALWWWWTHPGYPAPMWLHAPTAEKIAPPSDALVDYMKGVIPLVVITPGGVVSEEAIVEAIYKVTGKKIPLIPPRLTKDVRKMVTPLAIKKPTLYPTGEKDLEMKSAKPCFGPKREELERAPVRIVIPVPLPPKLVPVPQVKERVEPALYPRTNLEKQKWPERKVQTVPLPTSNIQTSGVTVSETFTAIPEKFKGVPKAFSTGGARAAPSAKFKGVDPKFKAVSPRFKQTWETDKPLHLPNN